MIAHNAVRDGHIMCHTGSSRKPVTRQGFVRAPKVARKPPNAGFGARMREAKRRYEQDRDPEPVYNKDIGERVGALLRRPPITSQAVGRWLQGQVPDDLDVIRAIAVVLGVRPGWLAFGEHADDVLGEEDVTLEDVPREF